MKKRLISFLLALLMLVGLPLVSLASERTTVAFSAGKGLNMMEGVSDLLNAVSFSVLRDDGSVQVALQLSGNQIVDAAFKVDEQGIYISSGLLDHVPYLLPWDYAKTLVSQLAEQYGVNIGDFDPAGIVDVVKGVLTGSADLTSVLAGGAAAGLDPTTLLAGIQDDLPELMTQITAILTKAETEEGEFLLDSRDPATLRQRLILTTEDITAVLNTKAVKTLLPKVLPVLGMELAEGSVEAQVEEALKKANEKLAKLPYSVEITLYTGKNGFVDAEIVLFDKGGDPEGSIKATLSAGVLTVPEGKSLNVTVNSVLEKYCGNFYCTLNLMNDGSLNLLTAVDLNGIKLGLAYAQSNTENGTYREAYLYQGDNVDSLEDYTAGMIVNTLHSNDSPDYVLNTSKAKDLSTFTEEDYQAILKTIAGKSSTLLFTVMKNLPASALGLLTKLSIF